MVAVALTSTFASFTVKANCIISRRNRLLSRDGATAAAASAALCGGTA
jgi:hypothetical protein